MLKISLRTKYTALDPNFAKNRPRNPVHKANLHAEQGKDENEEEEEEEQGEDGPHRAEQGDHQVPQRGPVSAQ